MNEAERTSGAVEEAHQKVTPLNWGELEMINTKPGLSQVAFRGDNVLLVQSIMDANYPLRIHSHPYEQITQVLEGTVDFHVNGKVIPGRAGSIVRFPPNVMHATAPTGGKPVRIMDVFSPARQDYLYMAANNNERFTEPQPKTGSSS